MSDIQTQIEAKEGKVTIARYQCYEPYLEQNKKEMSLADSNYRSRDLYKVASIPSIIVENFCIRNKITLGEFMRDKRLISSMLNDPALKYFRTKPGRV